MVFCATWPAKMFFLRLPLSRCFITQNEIVSVMWKKSTSRLNLIPRSPFSSPAPSARRISCRKLRDLRSSWQKVDGRQCVVKCWNFWVTRTEAFTEPLLITTVVIASSFIKLTVSSSWRSFWFCQWLSWSSCRSRWVSWFSWFSSLRLHSVFWHTRRDCSSWPTCRPTSRPVRHWVVLHISTSQHPEYVPGAWCNENRAPGLDLRSARRP